MASEKMRSRGAWARWLVPALVVLLTLKTTWGVLGTFDVGFDDETIYLEAAHWAGKRWLPLADSSPLYPLFYRLLSFFEPDPVRLYFLNWFVLTASLPLLIYALARRSGAGLAGAASVAVAWSMSMTVMTWPFVSKFAVLVLGAGALIATAIRDRGLAASVTVVAMALAAYARPELTMPSFAFAGLVAVACLWRFIRTFRRGRRPPAFRRALRLRSLVALAISLAAPFALRRLFGDTAQGGRAFFAFGQHYALNVVESRQLQVDPWTLWDGFAREAFPHATTIREAFEENRSAFLWHVRRNLFGTPWAIEKILEMMPFVPRVIAVLVRVAVVSVLGVGLVGFFVRRDRLDRRLFGWLPLLVILAMTTMASALLVYPREHYLLPVVCLGLAAFAAAGRHLHWPTWAKTRLWLRIFPPNANTGTALFAVLLIFLLTALPTRRPTKLSLLPPSGSKAPRVHDNERTIALLRALHLQGRIVILEPDHSRGPYAELDYFRIAQWDKNKPFWEFVRERQIDVIVVTWRLREDPRFKSDPEFMTFAGGGGDHEDFQIFWVPETSVMVAVRKSRLAPR
jgi:hypothetical protein